MPHYLSGDERRRVAPAEPAATPTPIPTQVVSTGEYHPPPQTRVQRRVEARITELADALGRRHRDPEEPQERAPRPASDLAGRGSGKRWILS